MDLVGSVLIFKSETEVYVKIRCVSNSFLSLFHLKVAQIAPQGTYFSNFGGTCPNTPRIDNLPAYHKA